MFTLSICVCKICQNKNFNHNWLRLLSGHSTFPTTGLPTVLSEVGVATGIFTIWLISSPVESIFHVSNICVWFSVTSAYSSVITSTLLIEMDFRNSPSTYGATSPCTRHKGAGPKCYHDVNMGPKTRSMRKLGKNKRVERSASMCNNVNNFTYQTGKIISRFSYQKCIIKTKVLFCQKLTQ